ncbi:unnamed protein product [Vicia faba]|uniref:Uncharacterized protein n=1 Tax=Vicia faba TaxID=3906 RepID=A0AAV0ZYS8_VICFA|nr:unnamed protein product [Vicia faba]
MAMKFHIDLNQLPEIEDSVEMESETIEHSLDVTATVEDSLNSTEIVEESDIESEEEGDEPAKKSKSLALKYVDKYVKSTKVSESEEVASAAGYEDETDDEEMAFLIKIF